LQPTTADDGSFSRILVVDDDDDIRDILSYGIEASGCHCLTADSGEAALKILESEPLEVVISDVQMKGMSGLELCRHVKEHYDADVIIITGLVNNFAYEEIIGQGASDFIEKPIRLAEIVARLKRVLYERQTREQLKQTAEELRQNGQRFQKAMEGSVQAIARIMELPEDRIYGLRMASVIHDLGKLTIPGEILCKPGRLSGPEYAMIKTHVQSGYDILKKIDFPWPLADIVIQHHERLDGSGYPQGLSGDEILLEARILSVADVFETIGSHRPYRPSLGMQKAMNELIDNSGRLYDSDVVDACRKLFDDMDYRLDGPKKETAMVSTQMQSL